MRRPKLSSFDLLSAPAYSYQTITNISVPQPAVHSKSYMLLFFRIVFYRTIGLVATLRGWGSQPKALFSSSFSRFY